MAFDDIQRYKAPNNLMVRRNYCMLAQCLRRILSIIGQNPSVSKSNRIHVVAFWFFLYKFEVHFIGSSEPIDNFPEVLKHRLVISQTQPVHL